jgi:DNA-binding NtrC family response regulator
VTEQPEAPFVALVTQFANRLPTLKEAEEALIPEALSCADGNQGVAVGLLSISRQALNQRLSRHKYPGRTAEPTT